MSRLLVLALRWLAGKLGLLLLIVAMLLVGGWLRSEWQALQALRGEIEAQEQVVAGLRGELAALDAALARERSTWRAQLDATVAPLRAELADVEARLARAQPQWQSALGQLADLQRQAARARAAARQARIELEALERASWWWDRFVDPAKALALERARARAALLERTASAWDAARERVEPMIERSPVRQLETRQAALAGRLATLAASVSPAQQALLQARARKAGEVGQVEAVLAAQRERALRDPRSRLLAAVRQQLPVALGILAMALLTPVAIKALFFFVLAPLAARRPPIVIQPDAGAPEVQPPAASGAAVGLSVGAEEALLVQPQYLQSSEAPARKRTQWLLNPSLPFASVASGMFALTRLTPGSGSTATQVVVGSQHDPLDEVAVLELPAGAALVLQPRGLAGVVVPAAAPPRITRHWRLGSLHAWLTLQLRYLVFHGPCRLVLKGCRGVRGERPAADAPRLISQAATLGFSANLGYRTTRSETFAAYLLGREALLNDRFEGGPGCFVYEALPSRQRHAGITGRGLEGLTDALLKAFGI